MIVILKIEKHPIGVLDIGSYHIRVTRRTTGFFIRTDGLSNCRIKERMFTATSLFHFTKGKKINNNIKPYSLLHHSPQLIPVPRGTLTGKIFE
jgi:hypothetical protein